jgi:hypothetical protein
MPIRPPRRSALSYTYRRRLGFRPRRSSTTGDATLFAMGSEIETMEGDRFH